MLSITVGIIFILTTYILRKCIRDLYVFQSEIPSSPKSNENNDSFNYEAIQNALETKPNKDTQI
ncbi:hypothetical protein [Sulfurospirillum barnesii]|uniref:Uncharacterized protein n=1 Tax=Sulfurospirillum barnesii (strain ATCC 700032 / DSM 10660 / SES-3) TaxID=760154 RepID=I3Y0A1_SULBS|nr:hypothetical protein [Sulfurospirillum barnesii]AFL69625.1 hypothetical protein Sulba_2356 [Sulfurospirillum barnesii SES-3]